VEVEGVSKVVEVGLRLCPFFVFDFCFCGSRLVFSVHDLLRDLSLSKSDVPQKLGDAFAFLRCRRAGHVPR
jgi:hypothetical protein